MNVNVSAYEKAVKICHLEPSILCFRAFLKNYVMLVSTKNEYPPSSKCATSIKFSL